MATLNDKNVGGIIKIKENGVDVNYIVVQKGKPSTLYDSSCDGIWVLREQAHSARVFSSANRNDYANSDIHAWLNSDFLNTIDAKIRDVIKTVKIPFKEGTGNAETGVQSGANGLSCKIFLLSGYEVGLTRSTYNGVPIDGALLSYFLLGNEDTDTEAIAKRICKNSDEKNVGWWLRSPYTSYSEPWSVVYNSGKCAHSFQANRTNPWARPAFVLPSTLLINSDGSVTTNTPPTITSDKTGNLGTLTDGFTCKYSVNDADSADSVTVTLTLDGVQQSKFTATKGAEYTYAITGNDWLKITNGSHTFKISASDGKDTVESTATFTRNVSGAAITLETPLEADDVIRACSLYVKGSLPTDTDLLCEVTNNGNDPEPIWEDCTAKVKAEMPYLFQNRTVGNGFAFNFRVTANRGDAGASGYITEISGGFE